MTTESISIDDAVSLLTAPTEETVQEEALQADDDVSQAEAEEAEALEAEALEAEEQFDEFDDDDEADEPEPHDDTIEVIIDGEAQRVTREEAAKGYQRQADYSRKTMDLAKQRKALAAEAQQIAAERNQYAQKLELVDQQLSSDQEPDWDRLKEDDPFEYMVQKDAWRDKQDRLANVRAERARLQHQQAAEQEQAMQQELAHQRTVLLDRIPAWKDQDTAENEKAAISEYAKKAGFSEDEIAAVYDARAVELLRKAWMYDKLMAGQKTEKKRIKQAPKAAKGGHPTTRKERMSRQRQAAFDKLKKSGRVDDAVSLLLKGK